MSERIDVSSSHVNGLTRRMLTTTAVKVKENTYM